MIKRKDLEAYMWGAANLLSGMIDAADFKQYIFPMYNKAIPIVQNSMNDLFSNLREIGL